MALSADEVVEAVAALADTAKREAVAEVVELLRDGAGTPDAWQMMPGDEDTWQAGFNAAIQVIESNYIL